MIESRHDLDDLAAAIGSSPKLDHRPAPGVEPVQGVGGTFLLNPADAFEPGCRFNALRLGQALGADEPGA